MSSSCITVSVISHRQAALVKDLCTDIQTCCDGDIRIILTSNVPEDLSGLPAGISVIRNTSPKGFGANHNAAFHAVTSRFFCVVNPDVRLRKNPFPPLIAALTDDDVGVAAPLVESPSGATEDSARYFPTVTRLGAKLFCRTPKLDYEIGRSQFSPDWVAGMFMLFRSDMYRMIGGFDERYFLYYEDVDLCARIRLAGSRVIFEPSSSVVHDARRASRGNPRHAWWHARSIVRYLLSSAYRELRDRRFV